MAEELGINDAGAEAHAGNLAYNAGETPVTSANLRPAYTEEYYLQDCGGYESFGRTMGRQVVDPRLQAVLEIANLREPSRVLDLGCGRGELAYQLARLGASVTAVDYSPAAIDLCRRCLAGDPTARRRTELLCASLFDAPIRGRYDAVLAADLVEHLSPDEVDRLYGLVATHLSDDGLFVVHTYPNAWLYRYDYARRFRAAAARGTPIPANPRSRYERELHINEQSPRVLRDQLSRHFAHVRLWFGQPDGPGGSLLRRYSVRECAAAPDIYAVASWNPIPAGDLVGLWKTQVLPETAAEPVDVALTRCPAAVSAGSWFEVELVVRNRSALRVSSRPPNPVHVAYHWLDQRYGRPIVHDGARTGIVPSIRPGGTSALDVRVKAPEGPGPCVLQMRLVQEGVRWFPAGAGADCPVSVEAAVDGDLGRGPR